MARIAFIVADMFEDSEFRVPYDRMKQAGHEAVVIGSEAGKKVTGKKDKEVVPAERGIGDVSPEEFDAIVIPGGYSPDKLRMDARMVQFTRAMFEDGKPVAAVCHAPWMLIEAGAVRGRTVTSWPSLKTDLINAGAKWVDKEVIEDGNVITSRKPEDLEAFSQAILRKLSRIESGENASKGSREAGAGRGRI